MRIGIVRNDLGRGVYISDMLSRVQRCFSMERPGQSRTVRKPTDDELLGALNAYAVLSYRGTDNNANVDTSVNNTLRISKDGIYTVITVTAGVATPKTTIRDDLNAAFLTNNLSFIATIPTATNRIQIDTVAPNSGPGASLLIDSVANLSTLNTPLGFAIGGVSLTGLSLTALKAGIYTGPTTINVSSANISTLSTFVNLTTTQLNELTTAIADLVAPQFIETGDVLLSFARGVVAKLRSTTYRPDGDRVGLPVGQAVTVLEDDGSTVFTFP